MSQHLPDGTWIQVGRAELQAIHGAKFTSKERQVIDVIWCHQTGIAWSYDTLKAAAAVSLGVVRRAIARARAAGLLERYQLPGDRAHRYARPLLGAAVDEGSALGLKGLRNVSGSVYATGSATASACSGSVQVPNPSTQGVPDRSTLEVPDWSTRLDDSVDDSVDDKTTTTTRDTAHEHATDTASRTGQHGGGGSRSALRSEAISPELLEILEPIQGVTGFPLTLRLAAAVLEAKGADRLRELVEDVCQAAHNPGGLLTARLQAWEETGDLVVNPNGSRIERALLEGDQAEQAKQAGAAVARAPAAMRSATGELNSVCYPCFVNQEPGSDCTCTDTASRFNPQEEPGELLRAHEEWQRRSGFGIVALHPALRPGELQDAKAIQQLQAERLQDQAEAEQGSEEAETR